MGDETSALLAGTETAWLNLYGITDGSESVGNQQSLLTRSTWLKVTGGSYNRIVGGRTNGHAGNISEGSGNGANTVTGDFNVQLSAKALPRVTSSAASMALAMVLTMMWQTVVRPAL